MPSDSLVVELAENLLWYTRRRAVDAPMLRLMVAWENRFGAQSTFYVRNGLPLLFPSEQVLTGAYSIPIASSLRTIDSFKYPVADLVYEETVREVTTAGAMQAVIDVGAAKSYTTKSDLVLQYLKDHGAEKLGRDVDEATKARVKSVLVDGYEQEWTRNKVTKEIKGLFAGFAERAPQKHIRNRAELISVNELGTAYSQGALAAAKDIEDTSSMELEKSWALAAGPCALCAANASMGWIPLDKHFASGHSAPTGHPACRCSLLTRVKPQE